MIYKVETIKDGTEKYFFIRNLETMSIEELPSKYLMHKIKCKRSPNTVKRTAFSICYYMKEMSKSGNLQRILKRCVQVLFIYRGRI